MHIVSEDLLRASASKAWSETLDSKKGVLMGRGMEKGVWEKKGVFVGRR